MLNMRIRRLVLNGKRFAKKLKCLVTDSSDEKLVQRRIDVMQGSWCKEM